MRHTCHAEGCDVEVAPKFFMCRRHWFMVPKRLRDGISREYRPGQERGQAKVSPEYLAVTREAIEFVARKEAVLRATSGG